MGQNTLVLRGAAAVAAVVCMWSAVGETRDARVNPMIALHEGRKLVLGLTHPAIVAPRQRGGPAGQPATSVAPAALPALLDAARETVAYRDSDFTYTNYSDDNADRFRGYMAALLDEYGKEIDGLVWDETFTVHAADKGTQPYTGYADAAMMSLVDELRRKVEAFSPHLAFLSSDDLGPDFRAPYALAAHGNYQDSGCRPDYWPFGLLPNFRNVLWSCNWFPDTTWDWNERAVDPFGAPVAISNGYGDDLGVSGMNAAQADRMLALFRKRSARRTRIGWLEQQGGKYVYGGKEIPL